MNQIVGHVVENNEFVEFKKDGTAEIKKDGVYEFSSFAGSSTEPSEISVIDHRDELSREVLNQKAAEVAARKGPQEGQKLGQVVTPDGIKDVYFRGGKEVIEEPSELGEVFRGVPRKFKDKHRHALLFADVIIKQIIREKREIPLLREEFIETIKADKQIVKDLESFGLIQTHMMELRKQNGTNMGGRLVMFLTPQGKSFINILTGAMKAMTNVQGAINNDQGKEGVSQGDSDKQGSFTGSESEAAQNI